MSPPKPPPLPLVLLLMSSLFAASVSSSPSDNNVDYTHRDRDPRNFGGHHSPYEDNVDSPLEGDADSDPYYYDSYDDDNGGRFARDSEDATTPPPDDESTDEEFYVFEDEFFDKWWPPRNDDANKTLMTMEQWNALYLEAVRNWELHQKLNATRPMPLCVVGQFDEDAQAFFEAGVFNQPKNRSQILKADIGGKVPGVLDAIEFYSIVSPDPTDAIPGIGRLNQWLHIVVKSTVPLEGFFIQAIMGPLGLPFGEFRADFECENQYSTEAPVVNPDNQIVYCRFRPMTAERHPNVFFTDTCGLLSREEIKKPCPDPRNIFRVHFSWNEFTCNFVSRMQFIIIAIESFHQEKFHRIITSAYEHTIDSLDGVAYPYYAGWAQSMKCNDRIEVLTDAYESKKFTYSSLRSPWNILMHYPFDECIQGIPPKDWHGNPRTCPPGPLKCTPRKKKSPGEVNETTAAPGGPGDDEYALTPADVDELMQEETRRTSFIKYCSLGKFCPHPNLTELKPKWNVPENGENETKEELPEETGIEKVLNADGLGIHNPFVKQIIKLKQDAQTTHGHLMLLACFVLFGIGSFPARFMKETLGLDSSGDKSVVSLGRWVWLHSIPFLLSMAVLWIGITFVIHFQDEPRLPCEVYMQNGLIALRDAYAMQTQPERQIDNITLGIIESLLHLNATGESDHPKNVSLSSGRDGTDHHNPTDMTNKETPLSAACEKTETAILIHWIVGLLATLCFHVAFFGGFFVPPSTRCTASIHMGFGYFAHLLSFVSLLPLLMSGSICRLVIYLGAFLFVIPYAFVVGGLAVQLMEDKSRGISKRKFCCPTNEGISVPRGKSRWGVVKAVLLLVSSLLLVGIYLAIFFVYIHVYDHKNTQVTEGGMDALNCPGFECTAPSWRIDAYVLSDDLVFHDTNNSNNSNNTLQ